MCTCGPACSLCCTIFSAWGCIFMAVIGVLLNSGYSGIDPSGEIAEEDRGIAAKNSYITAGIYGGLFVLCLLRYIQLKKSAASTVAYQEQRDERLLS